MLNTPREFVDELGGYRKVAERMGISDKTMHAYSQAKKLPPKWYTALCELAREKKIMPPAPDIFDFKPLVEIPSQIMTKQEADISTQIVVSKKKIRNTHSEDTV